MKKLTEEEAIKDMKERIKPDTKSILQMDKKFEDATQQLKEGKITKDQFIDTINAHKRFRSMTLEEFKNLPLMENISSVIDGVKSNESTTPEMLKAFLGPYRTKKQIIMDKRFNSAAILIGSIENDHIRYSVEKIDVINDEMDE